MRAVAVWWMVVVIVGCLGLLARAIRTGDEFGAWRALAIEAGAVGAQFLWVVHPQ